LAEFDFRYSNRMALGVNDTERSERAADSLVVDAKNEPTDKRTCKIKILDSSHVFTATGSVRIGLTSPDVMFDGMKIATQIFSPTATNVELGRKWYGVAEAVLYRIALNPVVADQMDKGVFVTGAFGGLDKITGAMTMFVVNIIHSRDMGISTFSMSQEIIPIGNDEMMFAKGIGQEFISEFTRNDTLRAIAANENMNNEIDRLKIEGMEAKAFILKTAISSIISWSGSKYIGGNISVWGAYRGYGSRWYYPTPECSGASP
jgi:hypothetical protein